VIGRLLAIVVLVVAVGCKGPGVVNRPAGDEGGAEVVAEAAAPSAPLPVDAAGPPAALAPAFSNGSLPGDRGRGPFRRTPIPVEQVARMVAAAPELSRLGGDVALFDPGDNPYLRRSKADREDFTFTPLPVLWTPEPGTQLLVVVGRGKEGSFVAAWWPLPDGEYRLAASFVMLGEVAPVALAYRPTEPRALAWTTCWKCSGETGHVALRDDHRVVIVPN
jgi:hypothetical protein